ncbi:MAG: hypothetical protein AUJ34_02920 [Parcubacteria group bacterium CG1_02_41_12]|nr:MAG: hypothetical protein AUJ34_02920 [Parcubacteria group bacterium CG1_02_41_12]PIP67398.1 MAG: hypothetical protein COW93_00325 [Parcubacteria group bacterium CG22_combo_CG10-13_8_21_14_all_41_9]
MDQKQKNYAFIDSQNLNLAIRDCGWRLDFFKFRKYLADRFDVVKAYIFIGIIPTNQLLYTYLQNSGYILVFKPTLLLPGGKVKGNVDAELVLHAMIEYDNYDEAVIVSGDGDFHCLIEHLKQDGKLNRLIIPNKYKYSSLLRLFADDITFLNNTREKLGKTKKPNSSDKT